MDCSAYFLSSLRGISFGWNSNENKAIPDTDAVDLFKEAQRILSNSVFQSEIPFSHDPPLSLVTR